MATAFKIVSVATGKAIGVPLSNRRPSGGLQIYRDAGGADQHWTLAPVAANIFKIHPADSPLVLEVANAAVQNGAPIELSDDHGGQHQEWEIEPVGVTTFRVRSVRSGKVLDVPHSASADGTPIHQFTQNDGANQHWTLVPVLESIIT